MLRLRKCTRGRLLGRFRFFATQAHESITDHLNAVARATRVFLESDGTQYKLRNESPSSLFFASRAEFQWQLVQRCVSLCAPAFSEGNAMLSKLEISVPEKEEALLALLGALLG
ncbi:MAG: hypothetical protein MHM6MM_004454, partial [Cercozoa sp. M6MM]